MDWKEKGAETIFIGMLAFLGSFLVKKVKPVWKELKRMGGVTDKVDEQSLKIYILEKTLDKLMHTDPNPVFITNRDGELVYANPAWIRMTGFSDATLAYGKGYLRAIVKHDREEMEQMSERLTEHPSSFEGDVRFQHLVTKEIINTVCRSEPIFGVDGEVIKTIGRLYIYK